MVAIKQNSSIAGRSPAYSHLPAGNDEGLPAGFRAHRAYNLDNRYSDSGEYSQSSTYPGYRRILDQAAAILSAGETDGAALLLDGLAQRMVLAWFACNGEEVPEPVYLLARLDEEMSPVAWWLRLALRAPDAQARLVHCRRLLDEIAAEKGRS